jgi:FKBP-type peptidyl-prolyl cis-trans isomerase SlyD
VNAIHIYQKDSAFATNHQRFYMRVLDEIGGGCYAASVTTIENGKAVSLEYVLTNDKGEELDRSKDDRPLLYLHGSRNIVSGLERQLEGKSVGDEFDARVPAEEGYGPKQKVKPIRMPRSRFPADVPVTRGMSFQTQTKEGKTFPLWVTKVQGPTITCTPLHPLSGVNLNFHVKVLEVRDATEEETAHGHVHGPGGHEH